MRREKGRIWTRYDKVQQAEPTEVVSNLDGALYAVMFNASSGPHSQDLRLVYQSLINAGVSDENILVLEGDGNTKNRFVNNPATIKSLDSIVDSIRQRATSDDKLLVYVTNHGHLVNGQCNVEAYDGTIWEKDFEQLMQDLPVNFGLFYFAQCHSGGFAERMGYERNVGVSSAAKEEASFRFGNGGNYFTKFFLPRLTKDDISIEDAFDYAVGKNTSIWRKASVVLAPPFKLTPQMRWQNADPSQLYLGSTSPSKK